jgi:hypothetical protein
MAKCGQEQLFGRKAGQYSISLQLYVGRVKKLSGAVG